MIMEGKLDVLLLCCSVELPAGPSNQVHPWHWRHLVPRCHLPEKPHMYAMSEPLPLTTSNAWFSAEASTQPLCQGQVFVIGAP